MMYQIMGLGHIMTASCIDHNSALMGFDALAIESMNVPNNDPETQQEKTNDDLQECLEKFMDPKETNLGMFTDLIPVKMRWISNNNADVSKLCAACKIHSKDFMDRKWNVANKSGSSIVGDIVEKFLLSMTLNAIKRSPSMSGAVKVSKPPKANSKTKKTTDHSIWICNIFNDDRWTKYVEKPDNHTTQSNAKALLAI